MFKRDHITPAEVLQFISDHPGAVASEIWQDLDRHRPVRWFKNKVTTRVQVDEALKVLLHEHKIISRWDDLGAHRTKYYRADYEWPM